MKLGIRNEQELKIALEELKADFGKGRILAQKTASGVEMICGMKKDNVFGAFLIFGLGGIFVEVLKDITFAILPINQAQAHRMITKLKGYSIFKGYRGQEPLYTEKVIELLLNVSELVQKESQIKEINLNPIFVSEKEVAVADAKITI